MAPPRQVRVIADAQGDLPAARREAQRVASLFTTDALVGAAATRSALLARPPPDLYHLAVHADLGPAGGMLKMHDKDVSALEIVARGLSSERVVLSGCVTALGSDAEGATSLAMAFLASGARQVLATLRPVTDVGAEETTAPFYTVGGATNPVQALAAVQMTLAESSNPDWPKFVIFGHDICQTKP